MSIRKLTAKQIREEKTARRAKDLKGRGIDGPRPTITESTKLKGFVVAKGKPALFDCLGKKCLPGDVAQLDKKSAEFFAKRGHLEVEIRFDDAKPYSEVQTGEAGDTSEKDSAKAVVDATPDSDGAESGSGTEPTDDAETSSSDNSGSRRKRSL